MTRRWISYVLPALLLLLVANTRVVCDVEVAGRSVPGGYKPAEVRRGVVTALYAGEEISRGRAEVPMPKTTPRLTLRSPDGDTAELCRALLSNTVGVRQAWRVTVGGIDAGLCSDPTALGEVMDAIVYEGAVVEAVAAQLTGDVALRRVYVPSGADADLMELSANIRGLTKVMSVTSEGVVRYG